MNISSRSKAIVSSLGALALLVYAVIADLGLSAGRVHYGVDVKGVEVGGLTLLEAGRKLDEVGSDLAGRAITFSAGDASCVLTPAEVGWNDRSFDTAARAMEVGRTGGPLTALWDRARAWLVGVTVEWDDGPNQRPLREFLDACEARAERAGLTLDRAALAEAVRDALGRLPFRAALPLPVS